MNNKNEKRESRQTASQMGTGKVDVKRNTFGSAVRRSLTRKAMVPALALVLAVSLAGCGKKADNSAGTGSSAAPAVTASASPAASPLASPEAKKPAYPMTVKDATGTDIVFDKAPERIVSITPSETEVLFAVGAADKVVAVDNYSDFPAEAKAKAKIGDQALNVEALLAQKPDIVFANSSVNKKQVEQLRGLGVKVFGSDPKTIDEVIERIELYGQILNKPDTAKKTADTMRAQKQQVLDAVKGAEKKKVYIEFSPDYTVGSGVFMHDLIEMAGGTNIMGDQKSYIKVDPEAVIKANPDVIIYGKDNVKPDDLKNRPGWAQITAVKNGKLAPIDESLMSRVSPRITQALVEFGKAIQPDKVK